MKRIDTPLALLASVALVGTTLFTAVSPAQAIPESCSGFNSSTRGTTTGLMSCAVPLGMTSATVTLIGAGGGGGYSAGTSIGGNGAQVVTTITLTPGEILLLEVGTGGGGASSAPTRGGGGGGFSAIFRGTTPVVIAGAGGGGGSATVNTTNYSGGNGGTPDGTAGLPASVSTATNSYPSTSGAGGTTSAGGAEGLSSYGSSGEAGLAFSGGSAGSACDCVRPLGANRWEGATVSNDPDLLGTAGSGGAGLFGGGGGGGTPDGTEGTNGSGGGGSSYDLSGLATYTLGSNGGLNRAGGGNGSIVFSTHTPAPTPTPENVPANDDALSATGGYSLGVAGAATSLLALGALFLLISIRRRENKTL